MTGLSLVTILFGVLILVVRGPLIPAPRGTLAVYRKILETTPRIRMVGLCIGPLSLGMLVLGWGSAQAEAQIITVIGGVVTLAVVVLTLMLPTLYRQMALAILEAIHSTRLLRAIGLIGVAFGCLLIYLGRAVA